MTSPDMSPEARMQPQVGGESAVERRARWQQLTGEALALGPPAPLKGVEPGTSSIDAEAQSSSEVEDWNFDRSHSGITGVTSPDGGVRTWVMQQQPIEGTEN